MTRYIINRVVRSVFSLFIILTAVFLLMRLLPVEGYFGERSENMDPKVKQAILQSLGLLDPWYQQLGNFYKNLAHGDLGASIVYRPKVPVAKILTPKMKYSFGFGFGAVALSLVFGCALGILMAQYKGKFWDKFGNVYILIINAVPSIVYYLFLQLTVTGALKLPMLFSEDNPKSWLLPLVSMSLGSIASYAMWIRRYMVDELNKDYVRLAAATGLTNRQIMTTHVIRNAFVPMAQYLPASILFTISGSIYIESLYSIPGMGGLLIEVIQRQDNTLVQALVLVYSSLGIIGLLLGDIAMAIFDPRIKLTKQKGAR